jgi:GxxExxY protein
MDDMPFKEECFQLVGFCMEIHRELGRGQNEALYKDALEVELTRASIPYLREKRYDVVYKGAVLPHHYFADFVISEKILFEGKAVEKLASPHLRQTMNYLAISKLRLGLLVNFGGESLEWKRVIL